MTLSEKARRRASLPNRVYTNRQSGTTRRPTGCWRKRRRSTPMRSRRCCGSTTPDGRPMLVCRILRIRMSRRSCRGSPPALRRRSTTYAAGNKPSNCPCECQTGEGKDEALTLWARRTRKTRTARCRRKNSRPLWPDRRCRWTGAHVGDARALGQA